MIVNLVTNICNELDMLEWIIYHLEIVKFDKIYIYDNDSDKSIIDKLKYDLKKLNYDNKINFRYIKGSGIKHIAYNTYLNNDLNTSDWTMFIDADEMVCLKTHNTIHDLINDCTSKKENISSIVFNWHMFGHNNLKKRNNNLVIENFIKCESTLNKHIKSLIKNNQIIAKYISPHYFIPKSGIIVDVNLNVIPPGPFNENITDISNNCINHYWCKSYEDWKNKCDICHTRNSNDDGNLRGRNYERWKHGNNNNICKFMLKYVNLINKKIKT